MKTNKAKQIQYVLSSDKINVLLMGTSGAGKSTLINSIIPSANAPTGRGKAVSTEIKPYTEENNPLTLIDSVGYEYSIFKQLKLKDELRKWTKSGVKKEDPSKLIHMIWFCIDSQTQRVFDEVLDSINNIAKTWKDVPIIVVLTKSFGTEEDDAQNIEMFQSVLSEYKHKKNLNIKRGDIIPVVAQEYPSAAGTIPVKGLDKLIARTRELMPEAQKNVEKAVLDIEYGIKRTESNGVVILGVITSATVGAIPIDFPDAALLVPIQTAMLTGISKIYNIADKSVENQIVDTILKVGGTTMLGKFVLNKIKDIPGLQIAGAVLNATVAGTITGILGEVSVIVFDKISRGELSIDASVDWEKIITDLFNDKLPNVIGSLQKLNGVSVKDLPKTLANLFYEFLLNTGAKAK